jgi:hypothetical protein
MHTSFCITAVSLSTSLRYHVLQKNQLHQLRKYVPAPTLSQDMLKDIVELSIITPVVHFFGRLRFVSFVSSLPRTWSARERICSLKPEETFIKSPLRWALWISTAAAFYQTNIIRTLHKRQLKPTVQKKLTEMGSSINTSYANSLEVLLTYNRSRKFRRNSDNINNTLYLNTAFVNDTSTSVKC